MIDHPLRATDRESGEVAPGGRYRPLRTENVPLKEE
jgi:hypothetical protein